MVQITLPSAAELLGQMKTAATGILQKDISTVQGFSKSQFEKIAAHTAMVLKMEATGEFKNNDALRIHFVDGLEELTRLFVQTLAGLVAITIEKIWNALVNVLWGAIDKAVGFALPRPRL